MSLQKGLQMYKKKNRIADAIKLTMRHVITCFQENSTDAAKITQFSSIINTFASEFSWLGLPAQLPSRLEYMVDKLLSLDMVDEVLQLTSASYPAAFKVPFLELRMRAYHVAGDMEGFWEVAQVWETNELFAYTETTYIFGTKLMDSGSLQKAINAFKAGYNIAENEEIKEKMKNMLNEVESRMKAVRKHATSAEIVFVPDETETIPEDVQRVAQDDHQQAEHEAERHGNN